MWSLYRKELNSFLSNITGYMVIVLFLLVNGLFLWVFPGNYNIFDSRIATLKPFFELAPVLYLLLIPAITMRMLSDEKRMGTLELLLTRPLGRFQLVVSKYLTALSLVLITLVPTLVYFLTIWLLGSPTGNIDTGATWGSFAGLLFLASAYVAIGLFASALTSSQVVAFLIAVAASFSFYMGFEFIASTQIPLVLQNVLLKLGINNHYQSISRGVVDSRDLAYFIALTILFLWITKRFLHSNKKIQIKSLKNVAMLVVATIASIVLIQNRLFRVDLTAEKRYSISQTTQSILEENTHPIFIELYLSGDLPPGMRQLQQSFVEKVEEYNAYSKQRIVLKETDLYEIKNKDEREKQINNLIDFGIQPVNLQHKTDEGLSTKEVFPGAVVQLNGFAMVINILKNNPMMNDEQNINQSSELIEYELTKAIRSLINDRQPTVAFLTGHGEANNYETGDLRYTLSSNYHVINTTAQNLLANDTISTLVVANPQEAFSESDKLSIDQFIMKGGKVLWCIDPVFANSDSLSKGFRTIAFDRELNLRDQLFKYGVRINPDLILDAECLLYTINTAPVGQPTKFVQAPFYFAPLAIPTASHPIGRNLNRTMVEFASSIDLVESSEGVKATPILTTSKYARTLTTPAEVSLQISTLQPQQLNLSQSYIPIGVLLEGEFQSVFQNRMTSSLGMEQNNIIPKSTSTKQIVLADGGIIRNKYRNHNGNIQLQPMGYDINSGQTFGNRDFIINCIDYLNDDQNITVLRTKAIKMRPLDKVKIKEERSKYQLLNIAAPILLFAIMGLTISFLRRRKYSKKK